MISYHEDSKDPTCPSDADINGQQESPYYDPDRIENFDNSGVEKLPITSQAPSGLMLGPAIPIIADSSINPLVIPPISNPDFDMASTFDNNLNKFGPPSSDCIGSTCDGASPLQQVSSGFLKRLTPVKFRA